MKKQLLKGSMIAAMAILGLNAMAQNLTADFNYINAAAVIDGLGDDAVWSNAKVTTITPEAPFQAEVPTFTSATAKVFFNDTAFFVLLSSQDDVWYPACVAVATDHWMYDKTEVYFDVNSVLVDGFGPGSGADALGHYQYAPQFSCDAMGVARVDGGALVDDDFDGAGASSLEFSIPFTAMADKDGVAFAAADGKVIGWDVTFIDNDNDGTGRKRLVWSNIGGTNESWNDMDACGVVTLKKAVDAVNNVTLSQKSVYPTTTSGILNVPQSVSEVTIINSAGQVVSKLSVNNGIVNVAGLNEGMYFVSMIENNNTIVARIIVK
jgi:hypothetical protein